MLASFQKYAKSCLLAILAKGSGWIKFFISVCFKPLPMHFNANAMGSLTITQFVDVARTQYLVGSALATVPTNYDQTNHMEKNDRNRKFHSFHSLCVRLYICVYCSSTTLTFVLEVVPDLYLQDTDLHHSLQFIPEVFSIKLIQKQCLEYPRLSKSFSH